MTGILNDEWRSMFRRERRFLVIDPVQFILVEPEVNRIGFGVVKFSELVQVNTSSTSRFVCSLLIPLRFLCTECRCEQRQRWLAFPHHIDTKEVECVQLGRAQLALHIRRSHSLQVIFIAIVIGIGVHCREASASTFGTLRKDLVSGNPLKKKTKMPKHSIMLIKYFKMTH